MRVVPARRDRFWIRHFAGAIVGMVFIYLTVGAVASEASTPLFGQVPADPRPQPQPQFTGCVPHSGATAAPGG